MRIIAFLIWNETQWAIRTFTRKHMCIHTQLNLFYTHIHRVNATVCLYIVKSHACTHTHIKQELGKVDASVGTTNSMPLRKIYI